MVNDNILISVSGDSTHDINFGGAGTIINNFDVEVFDSSDSNPIARLEMIEQTLQGNCNLSTSRSDVISFISLRCVEGVLCDSSWHKYVPIASEYNAFLMYKNLFMFTTVKPSMRTMVVCSMKSITALAFLMHLKRMKMPMILATFASNFTARGSRAGSNSLYLSF